MDTTAQIFAVALTVSQVMTAPDKLKTQFDPLTDQNEVAALLQDGCTHFRKTFDLEHVNVDDLIATAMDDPQAVTPDVKVFRGIDFGKLLIAYRQFCKREDVGPNGIDLTTVIDYYNKAAANLPDLAALATTRAGKGTALDDRGAAIGTLFVNQERRLWVDLDEIPVHVRQAFIAVEDSRFFAHRGVDEHGLVRAFLNNLMRSGRAQGGSTITQQLVKNVLVGADVSFERKIREMILASLVEKKFTKREILELYLNSIYLGRNAWGVELAARSYFRKGVKDLTIAEGALLAALAKGPGYFNPKRHQARARERFAYVIGRMREEGVLPPGTAVGRFPTLAEPERSPPQTEALYFADQVLREARSLPGLLPRLGPAYVVQSTLRSSLQHSVQAALQDGLANYEARHGRAKFEGPEANIADAVGTAAPAAIDDPRPPWQIALQNVRLSLTDVHWTPAVVVEKPERGRLQVGLPDGRVLPLTGAGTAVERSLTLYDVIYVTAHDAAGKQPARAELRVRPQVQGAVAVIENKTGRVLAMSGGFSYQLSQLNRATQAKRQPGSSIKPLIYLAALRKGMQPNSTVQDEPITLPPIGKNGLESWSPKNYEDDAPSGRMTLRSALAHSRNLATANLLDGAIDKSPTASLDYICSVAVELRVYPDCVRYYPFVLGAQPVRLVDLAAFYATIANEGARPTPHVVDSVDVNGTNVFRYESDAAGVSADDRAIYYQLKLMLQGVLLHGTASPIAHLAPYVAGKTGTTNDENDSWFVGFTNEVTVAVWVGYDNADGKRRTLGEGATGGSVALPIFQQVIEAAWADGIAKTPLAPPSDIARSRLWCEGGRTQAKGKAPKALPECARKDESGKAIAQQGRTRTRAADVKRRRPATARVAPPPVAYACDERDYQCRAARDNRHTWNSPWGGAWGRREEYQDTQPQYERPRGFFFFGRP